MEPWKLGMVGKRWPVYEGMGASGKGVLGWSVEENDRYNKENGKEVAMYGIVCGQG